MPLDTVDLLRMCRALRRGALPLASAAMVAEADEARATYLAHRDDLLARLEETERAGRPSSIVAFVVAQADHDEATRARAQELHDRAQERADRRRRFGDDGHLGD